MLRAPVVAVSAIAVLAAALAAAPARAQPSPDGRYREPDTAADTGTGERVVVESEPRDPQIERRLRRILDATRWFEDAKVQADEGVVFLEGRTAEERYKDWAGDLARRTEGVFAVVNRIEVEPRPLSDVSPAVRGFADLWHGFLLKAPVLLAGTAVAALAYALGRAASWSVRASLRRRGPIDLLGDISARATGLAVFMLGMYIAFRVAGLTRLAVTVLGGTGVAGLVLGIAFKDVGENLLASILLSRQQPFRKGDLVEIQGIEGVVERLTIRATVLTSLAGEQVQIPNSTVYKSAIRNLTRNPACRVDFSVGIGYENSTARAQELALSVVRSHPAVLGNPEPWVLVEALGSSVVKLRVYLWLDRSQHSWLKVRSSILRLVKHAFEEHGISMPDEAREVIFPEGVPVRLPPRSKRKESTQPPARPGDGAEADAESSAVTTDAEAGLDGDAAELNRLSDETRASELGSDLLEPASRSAHRARS